MIVCLPTCNSYVGSSRDIPVRWQQHRIDLGYGRHHSPYLQRSWDKYGSESFEFRVLEECLPDRLILLDKEQKYLDELKPVFNVYRKAGSPLGYKHTQEQLAKMSAAHKGKKRSAEFRAKISAKKKEMFRNGELDLKILLGRWQGKPAPSILFDKLILLAKYDKRAQDIVDHVNSYERDVDCKYCVANGKFVRHKGRFGNYNITTEINRATRRISEIRPQNRRNTKYFTKINDSIVDEIRRKYNSSNMYQSELAKEYGISASHVSRIVNYIGPLNNLTDGQTATVNRKSFKLAPDDIEQIISRYQSGENTQSELALIYKVSSCHISRIVNRLRRQNSTIKSSLVAANRKGHW